jgi:hypothetical protein
LLEGARLSAGCSQAQHLVEDHRPAADRGQREKDHHSFDDRVGLQEQANEREFVRGGCLRERVE